MKLGEIGEFGFIRRFEHKFDQLIKKGDEGIGDDCAIVSVSDTECHVITTDLLIEDIHFLKDKISPQELGHKSLAVNLSDLAAMGAKPLYSFLSVGIPKNTDVEYLDGFMEGYYQLSEKYGVPLMGGDTTKSADRLVINVAVIGHCKKAEVRKRSMAKAGDVICASGPLGDSGGGLKVLLENLEDNEQHRQLIQRHHLPEPMLTEGMWLAKHASVHAMMDISDGISSDLKHILKASNVGANVHIEKLPVSDLLREVAGANKWNATELAASGGEDYELLFTVAASEFEQLNTAFQKQFDKPLHFFGEIKNGEAEITWKKNGETFVPEKIGFDHFL